MMPPRMTIGIWLKPRAAPWLSLPIAETLSSAGAGSCSMRVTIEEPDVGSRVAAATVDDDAEDAAKVTIDGFCGRSAGATTMIDAAFAALERRELNVRNATTVRMEHPTRPARVSTPTAWLGMSQKPNTPLVKNVVKAKACSGLSASVVTVREDRTG
jgi:hypothetical protein